MGLSSLLLVLTKVLLSLGRIHVLDDTIFLLVLAFIILWESNQTTRSTDTQRCTSLLLVTIMLSKLNALSREHQQARPCGQVSRCKCYFVFIWELFLTTEAPTHIRLISVLLFSDTGQSTAQARGRTHALCSMRWWHHVAAAISRTHHQGSNWITVKRRTWSFGLHQVQVAKS